MDADTERFLTQDERVLARRKNYAYCFMGSVLTVTNVFLSYGWGSELFSVDAFLAIPLMLNAAISAIAGLIVLLFCFLDHARIKESSLAFRRNSLRMLRTASIVALVLTLISTVLMGMIPLMVSLLVVIAVGRFSLPIALTAVIALATIIFFAIVALTASSKSCEPDSRY